MAKETITTYKGSLNLMKEFVLKKENKLHFGLKQFTIADMYGRMITTSIFTLRQDVVDMYKDTSAHPSLSKLVDLQYTRNEWVNIFKKNNYLTDDHRADLVSKLAPVKPWRLDDFLPLMKRFPGKQRNSFPSIGAMIECMEELCNERKLRKFSGHYFGYYKDDLE